MTALTEGDERSEIAPILDQFNRANDFHPRWTKEVWLFQIIQHGAQLWLRDQRLLGCLFCNVYGDPAHVGRFAVHQGR